MDSGWSLSSSDDEDASILPHSQPGLLYASPSRVKEKQLKTFEQQGKRKHQICPYGMNCYRKNPKHLKEYIHTEEDEDHSVATSQKKVCLEPSASDPLKVWASAGPLYMFLTTCNEILPKYNFSSEKTDFYSMGIKDILSEKFGVLMKSVQFNYCIDIDWLVAQYPSNARDKPLLIVHGEQGASNVRLKEEARNYSNIKLCKVDLPPYGTHHTKMMLLHYYDVVRIVISTANLVSKDWDKKTQGFFMSPMFSIKSKKQTENQSHFKTDLIEYLNAYKKLEIQQWVDVIEHCNIINMDNIRLIGSVPGRHAGTSISSWGHMKLRKILQSTVKPVDSNWPVIGQFSSIGSLGPSPDKWLCGELLTSLAACSSRKFFGQSLKPVPLKLIFPTVDNVRCSLEGYPAGASLPYSCANARKQSWLLPFLHQWKADHVGRSSASPHIKSYTRISPYDTNKRAAWFLLTSANLSKAAWGCLEKKSSQLAIKSYELGVLFLPQGLFENLESDSGSSSDHKTKDNYFHVGQNFSLPFSLPLTRYTSNDQPWTWDGPHTDKPDRYGNVWVPS